MPYDNNNSGVLFRNDRKEKPTHPDHQGQCEINGKHYWISAWIKEGKPDSKMAGKKFFSLAFKPKDESPGNVPAAANKPDPVLAGAKQPEDESDVPF